MNRAKAAVVRLSELAAGQRGDFFALLSERTRSTTREGKDYFHCRFRDLHRTASVMVWGDGELFADCEQNWQVGQFYKIRGVYNEHEKYGPQIEIERIRAVIDTDKEAGFDPLDFVEHSRRPPAELFAELKELAGKEIADEPLRRLVLGLLEDHAERWQRLPATRDRYYPFVGGLLEHTLAVTRTCLELVDRYRTWYPELQPPLNRDLVLAGAVLHEVGRVVELQPEGLTVDFSVPGRLTGHLLLGRDLVRDKARALGDVNPELLLLLEHLLLSYLTLPEWGSPRLPLIPECLIVHHADDLDVKLEMYVRCLTHDQAEGPFTDREPGLNRQLLKGRTIYFLPSPLYSGERGGR